MTRCAIIWEKSWCPWACDKPGSMQSGMEPSSLMWFSYTHSFNLMMVLLHCSHPGKRYVYGLLPGQMALSASVCILSAPRELSGSLSPRPVNESDSPQFPKPSRSLSDIRNVHTEAETRLFPLVIVACNVPVKRTGGDVFLGSVLKWDWTKSRNKIKHLEIIVFLYTDILLVLSERVHFVLNNLCMSAYRSHYTCYQLTVNFSLLILKYTRYSKI